VQVGLAMIPWPITISGIIKEIVLKIFTGYI
jgi:hypothetical protein